MIKVRKQIKRGSIKKKNIYILSASLRLCEINCHLYLYYIQCLIYRFYMNKKRVLLCKYECKPVVLTRCCVTVSPPFLCLDEYAVWQTLPSDFILQFRNRKEFLISKYDSVVLKLQAL